VDQGDLGRESQDRELGACPRQRFSARPGLRYKFRRKLGAAERVIRPNSRAPFWDLVNEGMQFHEAVIAQALRHAEEHGIVLTGGVRRLVRGSRE
jgi:hypothetical protein